MVHRYKNNGYNIVLDVNSGAVHVVDDIVYDVIPYLEQDGEVLRPLRDSLREIAQRKRSRLPWMNVRS